MALLAFFVAGWLVGTVLGYSLHLSKASLPIPYLELFNCTK
jgi:hypothetical protein